MAGDGTSAIQNANVYSLGTSSLDRAFGGQSLNATGSSRNFGLQLINNTSYTLTEFSLNYTGEQWRLIQGDVNDRYDFSYQIFNVGTGTLDNTAGWTNADALDFIAPQTSTSGGNVGINGNAVGNFVMESGTVTGLNWTPGQELWLRWTDPNTSNQQRMVLAIDDVSFSAIPEPSTWVMLGCGAIFVMRRRFCQATSSK